MCILSWQWRQSTFLFSHHCQLQMIQTVATLCCVQSKAGGKFTTLMLFSDEPAACRIAALMVIFVQLPKCHLPQREDQAVSSILLINRYLRCFAHSSRSQTVDFYSTLERCRLVERPKWHGCWELQLWNDKRWSGDKAAMRRAAG